MANGHPRIKPTISTYPATRLKLCAPEIAEIVQKLLRDVAGIPIPFLLVFQTDLVSHYIGNVDREDAVRILQQLVQRWQEQAGIVKPLGPTQ